MAGYGRKRDCEHVYNRKMFDASGRIWTVYCTPHGWVASLDQHTYLDTLPTLKAVRETLMTINNPSPTARENAPWYLEKSRRTKRADHDGWKIYQERWYGHEWAGVYKDKVVTGDRMSDVIDAIDGPPQSQRDYVEEMIPRRRRNRRAPTKAARNRVRVTKQAPRKAAAYARNRKTPRGSSSDRSAYSLPVSNLQVKWFQGYAENVQYLRAADGKKYEHVVETDAAEIYLCDHPEYGHCILIVNPRGDIPLWK